MIMIRGVIIGIAVLAAIVALTRGPILAGSALVAKRHCSSRFLASVEPRDEFALFILRVLPFTVVQEPQSTAVFLWGSQRSIRLATAFYHPTGEGCILETPVSLCPLLPPPATIKEEPLTGKKNERLEALLDAEMEATLNGVSQNVRGLVVMKNGVIMSERYKSPFTASTRQHGWSMTKSLLATLVRARSLDTNSFVKFPNGTQSSVLRIGHLLNMTSGLDWAEVYGPGGDPTVMLFSSNKNMAAFVANRGQKYQPGTLWKYSSGDTNLLAWNLVQSFPSVCEYRKWEQTELAEKLGLKSAVIECDAVGTPVMSSFGWLTPRDWARWGHSQMNVSTPLVDVSLTTGKRAPYAQQVWKHSESADSKLEDIKKNSFYAQGFEFQYVAVVPAEQVVVVQLACMQGDKAVPKFTSPTMNKFVDNVVTALK